jgi:hypothetical protein
MKPLKSRIKPICSPFVFCSLLWYKYIILNYPNLAEPVPKSLLLLGGGGLSNSYIKNKTLRDPILTLLRGEETLKCLKKSSN